MSKTKCSHPTASGKPCKAWAVKDSNPPSCSSHAGLNVGAGAPQGNSNAQSHGFYSDGMTGVEVADLVAHADNQTLDDEIAVARVMLRRLFEKVGNPDLSTEELAEISKIALTATGSIARLLRSNRALSGEAADGISGAIAQALDELGNEWGVEL